MDKPKPSYYTPAEVAELFSVDEETVRRHCKQGQLEGAIKFGRQWRIPCETVDQLRQQGPSA